MVPSDFERWHYHAPRIRCLGGVCPRVVRSPCTYIDLEVINAIKLEPSLRLPNLREISWAEWNDEMFFDINPFLGPTVTHFNIISDGDCFFGVEPLEVLLSLSSHCPSIQQVNIPHTVPADLSGLISRWHSLTHLQCVQSAFTAEGIAHLACLPNLSRLAFRLEDGLDYKDISTMQFPALETLFVDASRLTLMSNFLDIVHSPHLRKIIIFLVDSPSLLTLQCFFAKVGAICSNAIFEHFEIRDSHNHDLCVITPRDLEPLFSFKNLRHLSIDLHIVIAVDNAWLKTATSTWPRLHHLQIEDRVFPQYNPDRKISPTGLLVLANLRELHFFMVRIDTRAMDWSSNPGVCSTTVKTLRLDGSNIEDPLTDFRHLLDMFPRVNCVGVRGLGPVVRAEIEKMLRENKRQRLVSSSSCRAIGKYVYHYCPEIQIT
jgi:hypothetical protein